MLAFLAIFMTPEDVGYYGLLTATIGWTIYFVGWDFYTFSSRELIENRSTDIAGLLGNQLALYAGTYLLISPAIVLVFVTNVLPSQYALCFVLLIVLEHLGLELGRILVALSHPLISGVMLFLRGGAWCLVLLAMFALFPHMRGLDMVMASWVAGSATGLAVGLLSLWRPLVSSPKFTLNPRWVARGLAVALPLMLASLAIRGIFTFDRFWMQSLGGPTVLGAYVLFAGIATALVSFIDAGIVDFAYPRVVRAAKLGNSADYKREMRHLTASVILAVAVLGLCCWGGFVLFLPFLHNPAYSENAYLLLPILGAMALYGLSTAPHVGLYAHGKDRVIVTSQLLGLGVFVAVVLGLGPLLGPSTIPWALIAAFSTILSWKLAGYVILQRELDAA